MNKIKEVLETKGLSQTELAGLLGKGSIWLISTQRIKFNLLFLSYIKLPKF